MEKIIESNILNISEDIFFKRQIKIWGKDKQSLLKTKKILIIGSGGLGSNLLFSLGGTGIGIIDIVDFDKIEIENLHRQMIFSLNDIGSYKSDISSRFVKNRNPFLSSTAYKMDFSYFIKLKKIKKYDLIIDATDNIESRFMINKYSKISGIPWLYGSVENFNGQVCFFDKSSFEAFNSSKKGINGNTAPMVMHIASFQANIALRYCLELDVNKDKLYYIQITENGEFIKSEFLVSI